MTPACVLHLQNERVGYGIGRGEGVNVGAPGGGSSCSVGWPPNSGSPTARPPGRPVPTKNGREHDAAALGSPQPVGRPPGRAAGHLA
jgi:hypothetical protein